MRPSYRCKLLDELSLERVHLEAYTLTWHLWLTPPKNSRGALRRRIFCATKPLQRHVSLRLLETSLSSFLSRPFFFFSYNSYLPCFTLSAWCVIIKNCVRMASTEGRPLKRAAPTRWGRCLRGYLGVCPSDLEGFEKAPPRFVVEASGLEARLASRIRTALLSVDLSLIFLSVREQFLHRATCCLWPRSFCCRVPAVRMQSCMWNYMWELIVIFVSYSCGRSQDFLWRWVDSICCSQVLINFIFLALSGLQASYLLKPSEGDMIGSPVEGTPSMSRCTYSSSRAPGNRREIYECFPFWGKMGTPQKVWCEVVGEDWVSCVPSLCQCRWLLPAEDLC